FNNGLQYAHDLWTSGFIDLRLSTFDSRPSTLDLRLSTFDSRPSTFDLRLSTFDSRPSTLDLRLSALDGLLPLLILNSLHALQWATGAQPPVHERVQVTVHDRLNIAGFHARSQVLHHSIRLKHITA